MDSIEQNRVEPLLLREDVAGLTTLTLNRPEQYNPLSQAMLTSLQAALEAIAVDSQVRVVVLAAKGKAFCAGHDLKEMQQNREGDFIERLFQQCSKVMLMLNRLPQPVIAKVQGVATAAGCQLVAACDLAVAVDTAKFATSGINLGLFCSTPAVAVSRNLSRKRALELLLTGEFISAQAAYEQGLLNRVVPAAALDATVQQLAEAILIKSAVAISMGKEMFYKQAEMGIADAYAYASQVMACNMMSPDAAEGIDAFIQKRKPQWQK